MANIRIIDLPTQTEVDESVYIPVESRTKGTRKYPIGEVLEDVNDAVDRVEAAIDAVDDISSQAIPLMSNDIRGGAKLEENGGLRLINDSLGLVESTQESDGEVSGSLIEVTANGHAEQFSTTGKNLFRYVMQSLTFNGITYTKNSDGSLTLIGSTAGSVSFSIPSTSYYPTEKILLIAGTYTISGALPNVPLQVVSVVNDVDNVELVRTTSRQTFTVSEDTYVIVRCRILANTTTNVTVHPMLEAGSTATEYEPYTGAAPSPSPNYPQEIQVVRGRNLFNKTAIYKRNHLLASDGSETEFNGIDIYESIPIDPTKSYYLKSRKGSNNTSDAIRVGYYSGTTFLSCAIVSDNKLSVPANATSVRLCYSSVSGSTGEMLDVQLTFGSTPQSYVPYGHVGMEVQGKNLLSTLTGKKKYNDSTGVEETNNNFARSEKLTCKPLTKYTVSTSYTGTTQCFLYEWDSEGNYIGVQKNTTANTIYTFTTSTNAAYMSVVYRAGIIVDDSTFTNCMLELGSTATEYQPYFHTTTPIPLPDRGWVAGLPDGTSDVLTLDGAGKVEWEIEYSEAEIDGVTYQSLGNPRAPESPATSYRHIISLPSDVVLGSGVSDSTNSMFKCTHFRYSYDSLTNANAQHDGESAIYNYAGTERFMVCIDDQPTRADMNAWLALNKPTILYPLATPVTESLGYIDMPSIPADATVTIPELDALNVKYIVRNTAAKDYAEAWEKKLIRTNPTGGLKHTNEGFAIDTLVHDSMDDIISGGIAELTAKGHAEQFSTTGKNLLPNTAASQTVNGVTFTVNKDGSITCNGTASDSNVIFDIGTLSLDDGNSYILTGCPDNGSSTTYQVQLRKSSAGTVLVEDFGDGSVYTHNLGTLSLRSTIRIASGYTCNNLTFYPQLELGSTATEYEPYTGAVPSPSPDYPQEIQVVRGRNLADVSEYPTYNNSNTVVVEYLSETEVYIHGSRDANSWGATNYSTKQPWMKTIPAGTYTVSFDNDTIEVSVETLTSVSGEKTTVLPVGKSGRSFTIAEEKTILIGFRIPAGTYDMVVHVQLECDSTAHSYVPYGHVGMEVRDPDTDELISCTPIPLPERGWVGSLPDGTADTLHLDGAGKCEWTLPTNEVTFDGSEVWTVENSGNRATTGTALIGKAFVLPDSNTVPPMVSTHFNPITGNQNWQGYLGVSQASNGTTINFSTGETLTSDSWKTWLQSNNVTVIYRLNEPTIEDCGYVDMPAIPNDATVTIPELDALGIRYFVDDTVTQYGREIIARVKSEYEDRLTALEQAVAELATS